MLKRATNKSNQQGSKAEKWVWLYTSKPVLSSPCFLVRKDGWPLLFVDVNKMVSAPFPRSHENGLPRNYLREATKMTMLWISAKMVLKKKTATATARQRFFFSCFLFYIYILIWFIFAKQRQSKKKQTKAKQKQTKAKESSAFICFALGSVLCTHWNYCVLGVLPETKRLIFWPSLTFKQKNREKLSASHTLNVTILLRLKCYRIVTQNPDKQIIAQLFFA